MDPCEFKRGDSVLQDVEKCCYMGDMISCYGGASEAVSTRIGSAWKKFTELSGVLVGKQGLYLKQQGKFYQCCVRPVLLYCCKKWQHTVADEARLCGMEPRMIRMMVNRMSTDVFHERLAVVKIEGMIIQSCLQWYEHVMRGDINSQIREVMQVEIAGKRKKSRSRELKECVDRKKWQQ